jgi:alpha-tubulin suppressor-like RCC1 family protein
VALTAGFLHACALLEDGSVKCWGSNNHGQLGQGDTGPRGALPDSMGDALLPVSLGSGRTARQVAAGGYFSCALLDDGAVKCWGQNASGQLGHDTNIQYGDRPGQMGDALPVTALAGPRVVQLAAGLNHACALHEDGTVRCWGANESGQLGQGDAVGRGGTYAVGAVPDTRVSALPAVSLGGKALGVFARGNTSCALREDGSLACWGNNASGQLLVGNTANVGTSPAQMGSALVAANVGSSPVGQLALGPDHGCALLASGQVKCWGAGSFGQLGHGAMTPLGNTSSTVGHLLPHVSLGTGLTVARLATSAYSSCALFTDGRVKCWGSNILGELGLEDGNWRGDNPGEMGDALPFTVLP